MAYLSTNSAPTLGQNSVTNALRDIKPPVDIPDPWAWAYWAGGILLAAVIGYLLWRYYQKRRSERPAVPPVPAHVRARLRLDEALQLLGQPKPFCIAVSDVLRGYLEERFAFRAPERTTEEFLYELQSTNLLTAEQKERLADFLQRCDLVKFAKYEPTEMELRDVHASAVRMVDETTPVPESTPQAATGTIAGAAKS